MSDHTHIEWTDATWNPITGCSVVSAGCKHCYAMRLAGTRLRHHHSRTGLTRETSAGPVWTGEVRFNAEWLYQPLRWRKPRRIFVCAHGDLFHESVPNEWIDQVFAVMARAPQHVFQVLTKRPRRMLKYIRGMNPDGLRIRPASQARHPWPLPNVWLGVSVENQAAADERIPLLLQTPAAVRFLSAEPMLGSINLNAIRSVGAVIDSTRGVWPVWHPLDWVIAGGESGPGARALHPEWVRALREQCVAVGLPFFFKQWGGRHPAEKRAFGRMLDGREWNEFPG